MDKIIQSVISKVVGLFAFFTLSIIFLTGCSSEKNTQPAGPNAAPTPTRVIVLGTIQAQHRTSDKYSLAFLRAVLSEIAPDLILAEIPPERLDEALISYQQTGQVTEARVARFPEYTEVIIPYALEQSVPIFGAAAWTQPKAEARTVALNRLARDETSREPWTRHMEALATMNAALAGREDDPFFIHTRDYDTIIARGLTPYTTLFGAALGDTGWDAGNRAHYRLMSAGLDEIAGAGKTVVITFGAAHKYWFRARLAERDDIKLVSPQPYLEAAARALDSP
ncbi:MAG: hypothetical protein AAF199_07095 [Pseudomonadota bacterium]